uniref:Uncharacterized protein n=1 Tax=Tetranychus urticae TaxID=32264 RepID=T1JTU8_TETUR
MDSDRSFFFGLNFNHRSKQKTLIQHVANNLGLYTLQLRRN